jgi:hypothetical protein
VAANVRDGEVLRLLSNARASPAWWRQGRETSPGQGRLWWF